MDDVRCGQKLVEYQKKCCHMIFDIKMDGRFTRKARYVVDGHTTDPPSSIKYSRVVSRDSVRIIFTLVSLNSEYIRAADIGHAYLNAKCREKIWTVVKNDFGIEKGKFVLVVRAQYSLKSYGADWRKILAQTL